MKNNSIEYKGRIVFQKVQMEGSFNRFPKLFQEDEACFLYMSQGAISFRTPTNLIEINTGEAAVAKCGNYFIEQSANHDSEKDIVAIGAYFYPDMVKAFFQTDLKLVEFKKNFDASSTKIDPLMKYFIGSISYLFDHPEVSDDNFVSSKLKELLIILGKTENSIHDFVNALFTPYEYDFREIIHKNTFTNLSMTELSYLCGCSLATFKRRFSKFYDLPPAKYFLQKKLEKSYQLLSLKHHTVSEIAYECGFENINHFNRAFKKKYGFPPSQLPLSQKDKNMSF